MSKLKILIFLLLLAGLGCKYEEGPLFSLVSIPNRISGDYHIESVTENGQNQMFLTDSLHIDYVHLDNYSTYSGEYGGFWMTFTDSTKKIPSYWSLAPESKKTKIVFGIFGCLLTDTAAVPVQPLPGYLSDGSCNDVLWDITKLSNSRMWLKISYYGNDYELHLKKI
jgi:hypothetical protein